MKTFILLWNPKRWNWDTLEQDIEQVDLTGKCSQRWSCGKIKSIQPGDRIFLLRLGAEPKGLVAAGFASSTTFIEKHWDRQDKEALYIDLDFEVILNADIEPILTVDMLQLRTILQKQNWSPQSSESVKPDLIDELEAVWFDFLTTQNIRHNPFIPADNEIQKTYTEGTPNQVSVTKYERNPFARKKCLDYYGFSCSVCDFNFENTYGQIGKELIHVHHLTQVATVGKTYEVDPIKDLRPVCPNCHSIIHKRKTAFSIDEVKEFIKQQL
jgi:5-methylcytosine-specific restriction protein A